MGFRGWVRVLSLGFGVEGWVGLGLGFRVGHDLRLLASTRSVSPP